MAHGINMSPLIFMPFEWWWSAWTSFQSWTLVWIRCCFHWILRVVIYSASLLWDFEKAYSTFNNRSVISILSFDWNLVYRWYAITMGGGQKQDTIPIIWRTRCYTACGISVSGRHLYNRNSLQRQSMRFLRWGYFFLPGLYKKGQPTKEYSKIVVQITVRQIL